VIIFHGWFSACVDARDMDRNERRSNTRSRERYG
jgi:hypothetical protein